MKILLIGPVTSFGGYGANARSWAQSLHEAGNEVKIQNFDDYSAGFKLEGRMSWMNEAILKENEWFLPDVVFNSCNPVGFTPREVPQVCSTAWETDVLPKKMGKPLETQDIVTVQSTWNLNPFKEWVKDVHVYPLVVNPDVFHPVENPEKDDSVYTFVSNGKWETRKGFDLLIKAFNDAFDSTDKVRLLIKTQMFNVGGGDISYCLSSWNTKHLNVGVNIRNMTEKELNDFYNLGDCFVLASRGEGFGVPYLEALACGLPCIAPEIGGHRDFVDSSNSLLVKSKMKSVIPHSVYEAGMKMVESNRKDLAAKLRFAYENRDKMKKLGEKALQDSRKHTYKSVGLSMNKLLNTLEGLNE